MLTAVSDHRQDDGYAEFERLIAERSRQLRWPVFTTGAIGLYDAFLDTLPPHRRQHYNCRTCRAFVGRYGSLVSLTDGRRQPCFWSIVEVPEVFVPGVLLMRQMVIESRITGAFVPREPVIGRPVTGVWTHLHGSVDGLVVELKTKTSDQREAEIRQDRNLLHRTANEFTLTQIVAARAWLTQGDLWQAERFLPTLQWFEELVLRCGSSSCTRNTADDLVWHAAATAPAGWAHLRNGMVGTILDAVKAGVPFDRFRETWNATVDPLHYRRPKAPPKAGNVRRAEEIVRRMGLERSFARRRAAFSEVPTIWRERAEPPETFDGIFSHLLQSARRPAAEFASRVMSWAKFRREVLPEVVSMQVELGRIESFAALVTAVDPDAPPMLQWDGEPRNPFSWYFYHGGSLATDWNLRGSQARVLGIVEMPHMWHHRERFKHHGENAVLVLDGCRDLRYSGTGGQWFPAMLRSELKEVDSVLEAHAGVQGIVGLGEGIQHASGLAVSRRGCTLYITTSAGRSKITIDRWD